MKQQNFISAVIYVNNNENEIPFFFNSIKNIFDEHFEYYELVAVNASSSDASLQVLAEWDKAFDKPLTVIHMSTHQSREACMNAGLDISIGDFIYEFDCIKENVPWDFVYKAYEMAISGNDVVSVSPDKVNLKSKLFYQIFNRNCNSPYSISSDIFRLVSRRALHRAHAINPYLLYRKGAFACSGLKCVTLKYKGRNVYTTDNKWELFIDSLLLYTQFGYKVSIGISITMALITLSLFIYTIVIYSLNISITGWTSMMMMISLGLSSIFIISTVIIKYLDLLLKLLNQSERYLVENVEKIKNER